jgi:methylmalonyl-CoA mutase N-terminal domain/subunit
LREIRAKRDGAAARRELDTVKRSAAAGENLLPPLITAARVRCTVGELVNALADVFGRYDASGRW